MDIEIISPSAKIEQTVDSLNVLKHIEKAIRNCYKSENKITDSSYESLIKKILENDHLSTIEHYSITTRWICDRGISHELVRSRHMSFSQESTRYCNYGKKGLVFIKPCFWNEESKEYEIWQTQMESATNTYLCLLNNGASPQEARSVLPNSLKTEIVMTGNLRSWREFFQKRTTKFCHPQMLELTIPLLKEFQKVVPLIFDFGNEKPEQERIHDWSMKLTALRY